MKKKSTSFRAILAALVCHAFWGLSFMASRTAMDSAPVLLLLSHRFLLAALIMGLLCLTPVGRGCLRGRRLLPLLLLGLFEPVIYFFGEQYGILHSSTIFSGVMISMIPVASILAAVPVLREKPTPGQLFFSLLSMGGVIGIGLLTQSSGSLDWIGVAGLLVAVFSAVAYTLLGRNLSGQYSPFARTFAIMSMGAVVFTAIALVSVRGDLGAYLRPLQEPGYLKSMLFLSLCCSLICFFLSNYVITHLSVAQATVFANLTTAVSVFAGAFLLREPFPPIGFFYCLLILLGIYGVQRTAR